MTERNIRCSSKRNIVDLLTARKYEYLQQDRSSVVMASIAKLPGPCLSTIDIEAWSWTDTIVMHRAAFRIQGIYCYFTLVLSSFLKILFNRYFKWKHWTNFYYDIMILMMRLSPFFSSVCRRLSQFVTSTDWHEKYVPNLFHVNQYLYCIWHNYFKFYYNKGEIHINLYWLFSYYFRYFEYYK